MRFGPLHERSRERCGGERGDAWRFVDEQRLAVFVDETGVEVARGEGRQIEQPQKEGDVRADAEDREADAARRAALWIAAVRVSADTTSLASSGS